MAPTKSDFINEINMVSAVSRFADVHYSGNPMDASRPDLGMKEYPESIADRVAATARDDYDCYVIRGSAAAFDAVPRGKPKMWFCAPYDPVRYAQATGIMAITEAWRDVLLRGIKIPGYNPEGVVFNNSYAVHQAVPTMFRPQPERAQAIRKSLGAKYVVGYFGRLTPTYYPNPLFDCLGELTEALPGLKVLVCSNWTRKIKFKPSPHIKLLSIPYTSVPEHLSACDATVDFYKEEGANIRGSLKCIESMACGVPVISGASDARAEALGDDYEYFVPHHNGKFDLSVFKHKLIDLLTNADRRAAVSQRLIERVECYRPENVGKKFVSVIEHAVGQSQGESGV